MRYSITHYSCNQYTFIGGDCVSFISLDAGDAKIKWIEHLLPSRNSHSIWRYRYSNQLQCNVTTAVIKIPTDPWEYTLQRMILQTGVLAILSGLFKLSWIFTYSSIRMKRIWSRWNGMGKDVAEKKKSTARLGNDEWFCVAMEVSLSNWLMSNTLID